MCMSRMWSQDAWPRSYGCTGAGDSPFPALRVPPPDALAKPADSTFNCGQTVRISLMSVQKRVNNPMAVNSCGKARVNEHPSTGFERCGRAGVLISLFPQNHCGYLWKCAVPVAISMMAQNESDNGYETPGKRFHSETHKPVSISVDK